MSRFSSNPTLSLCTMFTHCVVTRPTVCERVCKTLICDHSWCGYIHFCDSAVYMGTPEDVAYRVGLTGQLCAMQTLQTCQLPADLQPSVTTQFTLSP